jgi:hypothetical protein
MIRFPLLLICVMALSGCYSSGNALVMDQDRLDQIKIDVSTKEDVRRILGQPNGTSKQTGSYAVALGLPASMRSVEVWTYHHIDRDVDGATFIPIVGLFAGGASSKINTFTAVFDEEGIVRRLSSGQTQARAGLGANRPVATDQ